jgi:phenylalanine-4-hydroxylase
LDLIANQILDAGAELQSDHPGFTDPVYRSRRRELAEIAMNYKHNHPIHRIDYSAPEIKTWSIIYDKLMPLLEKHACAEHVRLLPLLVENCGYRRDNIPQAQDISDFLKECTGFTLRPVAGLLSARNFLYGLAFRVFFSTQYLRHGSKPLYTPEPDLVHELMGHAPLFADQAFADFSQEIGLAAIGATDEQITQLSRCYWFSVEFGLCMQNGERKAYGAGLLSSFGELEYAMSDKPEVRTFNPFKAGQQDYPITTYQPVYYAAQSFEDAKLKMQEFSNSFARPFNVRYNPYSQSLEVDGNIHVEEQSHSK